MIWLSIRVMIHTMTGQLLVRFSENYPFTTYTAKLDVQMGRLSFGFHLVCDVYYGLLFQVTGCFWHWQGIGINPLHFGRYLAYIWIWIFCCLLLSTDLGLHIKSLLHFLSQPSLFLILIFVILCIYREIDRGKDWSWCHRSSRGWWSKAFTCWRKLLFIYSMWETFYIIHTYLSRCYYQCASNTKWVSTLPDKQWISSAWQGAQLGVI